MDLCTVLMVLAILSGFVGSSDFVDRRSDGVGQSGSIGSSPRILGIEDSGKIPSVAILARFSKSCFALSVSS